MLIKFSVTDDMLLLEVQDDDDAFKIWGCLKDMHETLDKGRDLKKNYIFNKHGGIQISLGSLIENHRNKRSARTIDGRIGEDMVIITLKITMRAFF